MDDVEIWWRRGTFVLEPLIVAGRRLELENKRRIRKQGALREEEKNEWKGAQMLQEEKKKRDRLGFLKK